MSDVLGITGINGLGMLGLGSSGTYSSYYDPTMMGMSGMYSPYMMGSSYSPYNGMGMMGMYNPTFMGQMMKAQQEMEKLQLTHTGAMHHLQLQNQTNSYINHDQAMFETAMVDAAVNGGILNLATKVREGDADGICEEFDKLKQLLYQKYGDYFSANKDSVNPVASVTNFIENLYSQTIYKNSGEVVNLRSDIKKYGQTAFEHGFWKNLHGKDYHDKYSEETISYLFGTTVDNKAGKDRMESYGAKASKVTELGAAGLAGAVAVPAGLTIAMKMIPGIKMGTAINKWVAAAGAVAGFIGDWMWQQSRA